MRKSIFILISVFALSACNNANNDTSKGDNEQTKTGETVTVGGEKDEHGCLTAAGETWSQIKQSCIRIFDVGQRLNPIQIMEGEAVISAFVLFNDDKSEVELFLPSNKNNALLKTSNKEIYENGMYKFDTKDSSLYINGTKTYSVQDVQ